jgi:hypothetical protein
MRVAYHPTGSALSAYALDAWITASTAAWPTVTGGTLVVLTSPQRPFRIEKDTLADDRVTIGGRQHSKVNFSKRVARLEFTITATQVALWRTFYDATQGFRLPFIVEHPQTKVLITMQGAGPFPFVETDYAMHKGSVDWAERT